MKTMQDVQDNMSKLYAQVDACEIKNRKAEILNRIADTFVRAEALKIACQRIVGCYVPKPAKKRPKGVNYTRAK